MSGRMSARDNESEKEEVKYKEDESTLNGASQKQSWMDVWSKECRVIRTVSSVLEDEPTQQRIAEGISVLTEKYQGSRGVDLQEVTRFFFETYLKDNNKTFSVFQATHQSILFPALLYLRKKVLSEQVLQGHVQQTAFPWSF